MQGDTLIPSLSPQPEEHGSPQEFLGFASATNSAFTHPQGYCLQKQPVHHPKHILSHSKIRQYQLRN